MPYQKNMLRGQTTIIPPKVEDAPTVMLNPKLGEPTEKEINIDMVRGRALIVLTHCIAMVNEAQLLEEQEPDKEAPSKVILSNAPNAVIDNQGKTRLFPEYLNSPMGFDRGGSSTFDLEEVVIWIGKTFPDIFDALAAGVATPIEEENGIQETPFVLAENGQIVSTDNSEG